MSDQNQPKSAFLTLQDLAQIHPVSSTTRWRMIKRGEFPEPVRISPGRVAWKETDIRAWLEAR
jgi:prophage regulatory protein